jgi:rhodanese-related sulfurtransferase
MIAPLLRQLALVLALALLPALVSGGVQLKWKKEEVLAPGEVLLTTARAWGDEVQWIDARTRSKYERTHIPGAILLNEDEWDKLVGPFLDAWDPDKKMVVYCDGGTCHASQAVAERIRNELQLGNVFVLKGGWDAWDGK